ncbi:MAG TPA: hypothetical protein VJJ82_01590 [Candidatus Nanoarchaeia archaeon]|nr:hypothetical protein [Candidatus Nanoarchaeia archaeon]
MSHAQQMPANYSSHPYGKRSHFKRNLLIILIIIILLPGIPYLISTGFDFGAYFNFLIGFWREFFIRITG